MNKFTGKKNPTTKSVFDGIHFENWDSPTGYSPSISSELTWCDDRWAEPGKGFVHDRFSVDEDLFERVVSQYNDIRPHLISCCVYTAEELLGQEFLASLTSCEKRLAFACLAHISSEPDAEFSSAGSSKGQPLFSLN